MDCFGGGEVAFFKNVQFHSLKLKLKIIRNYFSGFVDPNLTRNNAMDNFFYINKSHAEVMFIVNIGTRVRCDPWSSLAVSLILFYF